jgi:hypothetical protein
MVSNWRDHPKSRKKYVSAIHQTKDWQQEYTGNLRN